MIVAYFNDEIIGQIIVSAGRSGVELTLGRLDSPGESDAAEKAWRWFCVLIREILGSTIVRPPQFKGNGGESNALV